MIRINLLEETRTLAKAKAGGGLPKIELAENVPIFILAGGVGLATIAVVVAWLYLSKTISQLERNIASAQREVDALQPILKQNEELNLKKQELNRRIGIIADLKSKQNLPVVLMEEVSRSIADHMWLDDLSFTGDLLTLKGRAQTSLAYSNFLGNLEESKYFLDVATGRVYVNAKDNLSYFTMTTTFRPPLPPGAVAPAGPAPTADGGKGKSRKGKK